MKTIISSTIMFGVLLAGMIIYFEPEIIKAAADDDAINVTQTVTQEISIDSPTNVTMSSSIPGVTGNHGSPRTGSTTWTVKSNNATGFYLALKASAAPAMVLDGTYHFNDYSPASAGVPDYAWTSPASGEAEFGYTVLPETPANAAQSFKDDGVDCNVATNNPDGTKCWLNFTAIDKTVINRSSNTDGTGEAEQVNFQTESNAKYLKAGDYTATITATATEN